jgi:hypothetical protein
MRRASGQNPLPGDTTADYTIATGDNAMRILYSAKDSGFGQVNLGVLKGDLSKSDSVLVRAYFKGTTSYDSAGTTKYGFVSLSLVTMSKNWTWRDASLGQLTFDDWKTYSIAIANDTTVKGALVPADRTTIDFFALQAYSKGYRGAIYIDWIGFKSSNGTIDTTYTYNEKAPEEVKGNVETIKLVPVSSVVGDEEWKTATRAYGATSLRPRTTADIGGLSVFSSNGTIQASFHSDRAQPANATLKDLQGRTIWSRSFKTLAGTNELAIPGHRGGPAILQIRSGSLDLVGKIYCP